MMLHLGRSIPGTMPMSAEGSLTVVVAGQMEDDGAGRFGQGEMVEGTVTQAGPVNHVAKHGEGTRPGFEGMHGAGGANEAPEEPGEVSAICADIENHVTCPDQREKGALFHATSAGSAQNPEVETGTGTQKAIERVFHVTESQRV
jgi:hypothetical protein